METLLHLLDARMETPGMYGWYHLLCLALTAGVAAILCRTHMSRGWGGRQVRRLVFGTGVLVLLLECCKQINYNLSWTENGLQVGMQWYAFPWQFCSMPMYVSLLTGIFRKGRVHDALMAFLATYAIFAGLCVMVYPVDVFISVIAINIQTMVCHGSMLVIGIYLYVTGYVKAELRTIMKAVPVFAAGLAVAMILNEIAFRSGLLAEGHTFNMFFISPHCEPSLPVYSLVQAHVAYPWCLGIYILGFSLAALVVLLAAMGLNKLASKRITAAA